MASVIDTYGELKTNVALFLHRSDLSSLMDVFCAIAESQIKTDLKTRGQEIIATGSLTGETLQHPSRYLETRILKVNDKTLEYKTPEQYFNLKQSTFTGSYYTSIGQYIYVLGGTSGDNYELIYFESYTGFSDDSDTNWLLTNYPDIYLWGICRAAAVYTDDDRLISKYDPLYASAVRAINNSETKQRYSGPIEVKSDVKE